MSSLSIFAQAEASRQIEIIEVGEHTSVKDIIKAALQRGLFQGDEKEALVYVEDRDDPLDNDKPFLAQGGKDKDRVIVHRCRRVDVTVAFNARREQDKFSPAATVARVKKWFVKEIGMTPVDASEHVLQLAGTTDRPDPDTHIGTLVAKGLCSISFTLVPRKRVEG
ncbi:MAG: hypothetical protein BGO82_05570 [Devosia sp. 67-54]|uniref:hypothetical protein n=1 Tax=unclassified Devosia TaxID=196773 RepID=UPI000958E5AE|nr:MULTISPECIES: hypothetical protein [unclassified Devosia]MBN9306916.1 hypothetical protein [Devosia sp.]OJX16988.1 MAG: hypothetical protein BGO82_05570 [Devosia sp. 67-54]